MRVYFWLILSIVFLAGCGRSRHSSPQLPASSPPKSGQTEALFVDLLKDHGHKDVVTTTEGVGIKGNATRLKASLYGSKKREGGFVVETEVRIKLHSGHESAEYVAGVGE